MVSWLAVFAAGCLAFSSTAPRAVAADASAVQAASYSVGKGGARLKWLAQRPVQSPSGAAMAAHETSEDACGESCGLRMAQGRQTPADVFDEPFPAEKTFPAPSPLDALNGRPRPQAADSSKTPSKPLLLEQELTSKQFSLKEGCPSPKDMKSISELNTNIEPSKGEVPQDCPLGNDAFQARSFAPMTFTWTASALCHKPLYFEDVQLERYGHMAGPWLQPFASGVNFFLTFPILPYKMGLETPNECMYTLGYYRPGSCAPYLFDPLPLSVRAALFEAGGWVAACAILP